MDDERPVSVHALTSSERGDLARYETVIAGGIGAFVAVGNALAAVRDGRLYRAHHDTFEDYAQRRWNLSRSRAYQMIDAAAVSTIVDVANEGQARALSGLPPAQVRAVHESAQQQTGRRAPPAAALRAARDQLHPAQPAPADTDPVEAPGPTPEAAAFLRDWTDTNVLQDSGYLRAFTAAMTRSDDFLQFDPERLARILNDGEVQSVAWLAASAARFSDKLQAERSGLRVIQGGKP